MNKKIRMGLGGLFIVVIVVTGLILFFNRDTLFTNRAVIEYPDGCVEVYINTVLQGNECTNGRQIVEEREAQVRLNFTEIPGIN